MQIKFSGEAGETFQRIVSTLEGFTIELTIEKPNGRPGEVVSFDATLLGPDNDSEWYDAVLYRVFDENTGGPVGPIESARAQEISVY